MIAAALAFLRLIPLKVWIGGFAALAILASVWWYGHRQYNAGWHDALATVSAQNETARKAAKDAQSAVDACYSQNGEWDVTTGSCR